MHWLAAYLSLLSDSPLLFWSDLQRLAIHDGQQICFRDFLVWTDYSTITSSDQSSAVLYSHRMAASWAKYKIALHRVLGMIPDWEPRRCNSNSLDTVLFLQRIHARKIENMHELQMDAEGQGFSCSELTTDHRTVSEIIRSVMHVRLLIGVNSAAYNAIFMPASSAVLEIDAKLGGYYKGSHSSRPQDFLTTHIGYHWLGIHLYLYILGDRFEKDEDATIMVPMNVTRRALSAMRYKLGQQEIIGCCETTSLDREECRGSWQLVARTFTLTVLMEPDGDPMNLDIPDIHDPASVSQAVAGFCEEYLEMLANFQGLLATRDACFSEMMKKVEEQTGKSYTLVSKSDSHGNSGALSPVKVLQMFQRHVLGLSGCPRPW